MHNSCPILELCNNCTQFKRNQQVNNDLALLELWDKLNLLRKSLSFQGPPNVPQQFQVLFSVSATTHVFIAQFVINRYVENNEFETRLIHSHSVRQL